MYKRQVTASGPLTLVFHLSSADDNFLEKLTLPGAMPCDEEFFNSTRGTYGLLCVFLLPVRSVLPAYTALLS